MNIEDIKVCLPVTTTDWHIIIETEITYFAIIAIDMGIQTDCFYRKNMNSAHNNGHWRNRREHQSRPQQYQRTTSPDSSPVAEIRERGRTAERNTCGAILSNKGQLTCYPALVNKTETMCLRDTGVSTIFCSRNLILPNQFLTSFEDVHLANGCTVKCQTGIIDIDSPWLTGTVKAIVMDKP